MENQQNNQIMQMTNFRCKLHELLENEDIFDTFISFVLSKISTISYSIDPYNKCSITLKIRKSIYKRNINFIHNVLYYEPIINDIYIQFLLYISKLGIVNKDNMPDVNFTQENIYNIMHNNISLLYNITCISDNIIILHI